MKPAEKIPETRARVRPAAGEEHAPLLVQDESARRRRRVRVDRQPAVGAVHGLLLTLQPVLTARAGLPPGEEPTLSHTIASMSTGQPEPTPEEQHEDPQRVIDPDEES